MTEHWSWLTGAESGEYTYSPPSRPIRPPHRPLVKVATSAHLHTIASFIGTMASKIVFMMVIVAIFDYTIGDAEVMSHVTAHFGKTLEECREESGLTTDIMEAFQHFWREDFEVVHRELGCALICMSNKFSLMHDDARMHHVNMEDYIKSFPRGDILSAKMVQLIHNCEKQYDSIEDDCNRVVKVAACFKVDAKKEGIAPELAMIESFVEKY